MSLTHEFERQLKNYSTELLDRECALIELGRASARAFDGGHDPAGSRVQRVLTDLRRLADRWERLTVPVAPAPPAVSELDKIRAKRAARDQGAH